MAVGAKDGIDQMLVKRYAGEKVDNPEDATKLNISSDRYWEIQKDVAQVQMAMMKVACAVRSGLKPNNRKTAASH